MAQIPASKHHETTPSVAPTTHPTLTHSEPLNSGNVSTHTNSCLNTPHAFCNKGRDVLSLRSMVLDRPRVLGERLTGTVKWFNSLRGYGFITPSSGGEDVFVHYSSIKSKVFKSLSPDEDVEFQIGTGYDGRDKAVDVSVLGQDDGGGLLTVDSAIKEQLEGSTEVVAAINAEGKDILQGNALIRNFSNELKTSCRNAYLSRAVVGQSDI